MPRPKKSVVHPFDVLAHQFAELVAGKLGRAAGLVTNAARKATGLKGPKKDMACRVQGCKNRSGGPYWGYICEQHRKSLSKAQQQAAREAWKAA